MAFGFASGQGSSRAKGIFCWIVLAGLGAKEDGSFRVGGAFDARAGTRTRRELVHGEAVVAQVRQGSTAKSEAEGSVRCSIYQQKQMQKS